MLWKIYLESLPGTGHQKKTFTECTCIVKRWLTRTAIKHTLEKACPGLYFLRFLLLQGGSAVQVWGEVGSRFLTLKELRISLEVCKGWWRQPQTGTFCFSYCLLDEGTKENINIPVDGKTSLIFIYSIHSPETFLWDSKENLKVFQLPFMASICPWREVWDLLWVRQKLL